MTSAFNGLMSSSSDLASRLSALNFSNSKLPTTLIIQPPSLCHVKQSSLLNKRCKPAELGDLLMKKIRSQTANSSENNSPALKRYEDHLYESSNFAKGLEGIENTSMVDEIDSPSIKSYCDETDRVENQKSFGNFLMAQRSISTPMISNHFSLKAFKLPVNDGHKQIQHALKVLEKKMMIEQQATALKEFLLSVNRVQEPLNIPPLITPSESPLTAVKKGKFTIRNGDEEQEVIYGDVEYPFLSQSSSSLALRKVLTSSKSNDSDSSSGSSPVYQSSKNMMDFDDCLTATRAETQRSESELEGEKAKGKKQRSKKANAVKDSEVTEKAGKGQKREKAAKAKKEKSPEPSPVKSKKSAERRKNKSQSNEEADQSSATRKKASKVKWAPNEEKTIFFNGLNEQKC